MSVLTDFRIVAPEFAATADATVDAWTDIVSGGLDAETFGTRMNLACARLIAHELTLLARAAAGAGSASGAVSSIRTADLSVTFATPSAPRSLDDEALCQTPHGLAFLQIRGTRSNVGFGLLT